MGTPPSNNECAAILQAIQAVQAMVEQQNEALQRHIDEEMSQIGRFVNAFPDGDLQGHKTAHQEWIEEVKRRKEFWIKMKFELTRWGLIGFLGWLAYQAWLGFLKGPLK